MRKFILWIDLEYLMGPLEFVPLLVDFLHLFGCNVPKQNFPNVVRRVEVGFFMWLTHQMRPFDYFHALRIRGITELYVQF